MKQLLKNPFIRTGIAALAAFVLLVPLRSELQLFLDLHAGEEEHKRRQNDAINAHLCRIGAEGAMEGSEEVARPDEFVITAENLHI